MNFFLVYDQEVLNKYNKIWDKIKDSFGKRLDSEPLYNDKYIKSEISLYSINFYDTKMLIENKRYICLFVILLDSTFANLHKEYYSQIFLKECKYTVKSKKIMNNINEELELDESDDEYDDSYERINEY